MVDYYRVLGVSRDASSEDIKAAFRRMAFKFHPDRHANASKSEQSRASDSFRQVKEAYEVLGDERRRDAYNRTGSTSSYSRQGTSGSPYSSAYSSAYAARGAYERSSQQWQRASGGAYRTEWSYNRASYGGRNTSANTSRHEYQRSVRWKNWPPPAEGPRIVLRATLFGMAVVTLMFMDSIINSAWQRNNQQKSYEEMLKVFEERKLAEERIRERKSRSDA